MNVKNNIEKMEYKTLVDKENGNFIVISIYGDGEYVLNYCAIPELYKIDSTLDGINRFFHNKLDLSRVEFININIEYELKVSEKDNCEGNCLGVRDRVFK